MKSKTVVITGCSSGFGKALVRPLLENGWHVVATLRNARARTALFEAEQSKFGNKLTVLELDVADAEGRKKIVEHLQEAFQGELTAIVNNAGYGLMGALEDLSEEQIREQFEVNFFGLLFLTKSLLPLLRAAKGRIVNVSSMMSFYPMPLSSIYGASKSAVTGFSDALYYELRPLGVQVCSVAPGGHRTEFSNNLQRSSTFTEEGSTYGLQGYNLSRIFQNVAAGKGKSPADVGQVIVKLLESKHMPQQVNVGIDAKLAYLGSKLLPAKIWVMINNFVFRRILHKPLSRPLVKSV